MEHRHTQTHTQIHTHTHNAKLATEYEDVTALWNQGVSTNREVKKNRPDLLIKNKQIKFAY
jgi:hypothetical protein